MIGNLVVAQFTVHDFASFFDRGVATTVLGIAFLGKEKKMETEF